MNIVITYPAPSEYADNVKKYIEAVQGDDLIAGLRANQVHLINRMLELKAEQLNHRYQPGKWTIKEVLVHLIDAERIFAYRALRFARQDTAELHGFDQDKYIMPSKANNRTVTNILTEYSAVRQATIELFKNFDAEALNQSGVASNNRISVRALGYTILGHETHHLGIIEERYLAVAP